jgi:3-oxoacyl-[acyl-carrier protein] reductase
LRLKGKVALITGATRGIGWSIAQLFATEGATVIITGKSSLDTIKERVQFLQTLTDAEGFAGDVGDYSFNQGLYKHIFARRKRLDILVNNAGILEDNLLGMVSPDQIQKVFSININGVIYNMQLASRLMQRNKYGSIINMSSIIGRVGNEGQVVYGASKAAVIGATLSAAKELASSNIRVNAIAPGFIETDMTKNLSEEKYQERLNSIKMKRIGTANDIANAALFFASNESEYITGQILGVDGGMLI